MPPDQPSVEVKHPDRSSGGAVPQVVLYPIFERHDNATFELAVDIAEGSNSELLILDLLSTEGELVDESQRVGRRLLQTHLDDNHAVDARVLFRETSAPVKTVTSVARSHNVELIVFDEHTPESLATVLRGDVVERVQSHVPTNTVTVSHRTRNERLSSILVPIAEGPHSKLSVAIAGALAVSTDAVVELFHVSETINVDETERIARLFRTAKQRLPSGVDVDTWSLEESDVASAIIEQTEYYDVTIVGDPERSRLRRFISGSITDDVNADSANTVLTAHKSSDVIFGG